jgi:hypothetical protein
MTGDGKKMSEDGGQITEAIEWESGIRNAERKDTGHRAHGIVLKSRR